MSEGRSSHFILGRLPLSLMLAGVLALVLAVALGTVEIKRFLVAWQGGWTFAVSLSIGALFVLLFASLTGSTWIVAVRRVGESLSMLFPLWAVLAIPILLSAPALYPWADTERAAHDPVLVQRLAFMNLPFFSLRGLAYLGVFFGLALLLRRSSLAGRPTIDRMRFLAGPGMVAFALCATFAAFDWVMSLAGTWYSTIFGIYFFVGAATGALGLWLFLTALLERRGLWGVPVGVEHRHDLAKYLYTLTLFWAHVAFLQFLLIWYAKLPEETFYYAVRSRYGWEWVTGALMVGHLLLPLFLFMGRRAKRSLALGGFFGLWMLLMHALDVWWMTAPSNFPMRRLGAVEILCFLGFGLLAVGGVLRLLGRSPLVPDQDPRLEASLKLRSEP